VSDLFDVYVQLVQNGYPEINFSGKPTATENRTVGSGFGRTMLETVNSSKQPFQVVDAFYNALYFKYLEGVVPRKYAYPKAASETAESKGEIFTNPFARPARATVRTVGFLALSGVALYAFFAHGLPAITDRQRST